MKACVHRISPHFNPCMDDSRKSICLMPKPCNTNSPENGFPAKHFSQKFGLTGRCSRHLVNLKSFKLAINTSLQFAGENQHLRHLRNYSLAINLASSGTSCGDLIFPEPLSTWSLVSSQRGLQCPSIVPAPS